MSRKIEVVKKHPLDFQDELELHKKGWIAQRIGWIFLAMVFTAAAIGVFGDGVISKRRISNGDVTIEFEKFSRFQTTMRLRISLRQSDRTVQLKIPQHYLEQCEIEKLVPEPEQQFIVDDLQVYTFNAQRRGNIFLYLTPKKVGQIKSTFRVNDTDFTFSHFVYP